MATEAALTPAEAGLFEAERGTANDDGVGRDRIHPRDLGAVTKGIIDNLVADINAELGKSYLLRRVIEGASRKFALHVEREERLRITDHAVGVILQKVFLRVSASLAGEARAFAAEDFVTLEEPLRSTVDRIADRVVKALRPLFLFPGIKSKAKNLSDRFFETLVDANLRSPESLVGDILHQVWLRIHTQLQA